MLVGIVICIQLHASIRSRDELPIFQGAVFGLMQHIPMDSMMERIVMETGIASRLVVGTSNSMVK